MSVAWMDGFDLYTSASDTALTSQYTLGGSGTIGTTAGRFGGGAYQAIGSSTLEKIFPAALTSVWISFAFYPVSTANSNAIIASVIGAALNQGRISYNQSTGLWQALNGGSAIGSTTFQLNAGTFYWIEWNWTPSSSSTGTFSVWVNGTQIINLTSQTTVNGGATNITAFYFGGSVSHTYDDLIIQDETTGANTTRLGDSRIETLVPSSDASPNNGTPLTGTSHFAMVDEAQNDGDTSYNTITNTSGQEELYGFGSLANTSSNIWAIKVVGVMKQVNAGTQDIESVVSSSGSVSTGGSTAITTAYATYDTILETDPHTSAQWAYTAVNAVKAGYKVP